MPNPTSGSKTLSPSCPNHAVIAQTVSVSECAFEKIRHRLETLMGMLWERRRRSHGELIQQNERIVRTCVKRGEEAPHFCPCSFPHPYGTASPEHHEVIGTNSESARQNCWIPSPLSQIRRYRPSRWLQSSPASSSTLM